MNVSLQTEAGGLRTDEASLLTWELEGLAQQLEMLSGPQLHRRWQAELKPLEPYLKLRFLEDETGLFFTGEMTVHLDSSIQSHKIQWEIEHADLERFRAQLNHILTLFPVKEQP